jgi:hypothetical protein
VTQIDETTNIQVCVNNQKQYILSKQMFNALVINFKKAAKQVKNRPLGILALYHFTVGEADRGQKTYSNIRLLACLSGDSNSSLLAHS